MGTSGLQDVGLGIAGLGKFRIRLSDPIWVGHCLSSLCITAGKPKVWLCVSEPNISKST